MNKAPKMNEFLKIDSISKLHRLIGYPKPMHPLISVVNLSEVKNTAQFSDKKLISSYYSIYLKTGSSSLKYGRSYYDFEEGTLVATAPEQVISLKKNEEEANLGGWALYFHPDLIRQYPLANKMKQYGFFSYESKEALHLSDKEKAIITSVFEKITEEYETNIDEFSQDVLVTSVELLLNYVQRYYKRQFITRKVVHSDLLSNLENLIKEYFNSELLAVNGLPKVSYFASRLNLSPSYLSDLLKKETGRNAQEHIHYYLIEKAKNLLLNTNLTVSEIAFQLGFEYPQYFSRIFKKKTSHTPIEFRNLGA